MYDANNDWNREQRAIDQRRRIADMLMARGEQPIETTVESGYVVPASPLAGLDKIAASFSGALLKKQAKRDAYNSLYTWTPPDRSTPPAAAFPPYDRI